VRTPVAHLRVAIALSAGKNVSLQDVSLFPSLVLTALVYPTLALLYFVIEVVDNLVRCSVKGVRLLSRLPSCPRFLVTLAFHVFLRPMLLPGS